jgi:hypothetical protein
MRYEKLRIEEKTTGKIVSSESGIYRNKSRAMKSVQRVDEEVVGGKARGFVKLVAEDLRLANLLHPSARQARTASKDLTTWSKASLLDELGEVEEAR